MQYVPLLVVHDTGEYFLEDLWRKTVHRQSCISHAVERNEVLFKLSYSEQPPLSLSCGVL